MYTTILICIDTPACCVIVIVGSGAEHRYRNVIVGSGGSGHAFKLGPVIGRILSQLALTGISSTDISMFSATRPAVAAPAAKL